MLSYLKFCTIDEFTMLSNMESTNRLTGHRYAIHTLEVVRLRWFGADLIKLQYLCHFSWDLRTMVPL